MMCEEEIREENAQKWYILMVIIVIGAIIIGLKYNNWHVINHAPVFITP